MKSKILFQSMKFINGLNTTVRFGEKWMYFSPSNIDVLCKYSKRFNELTSKELKHLHDSSINTRSKLFKQMKLYYPKFKKTSLITVIWFYIDKSK